mmetsp:Transcript_7112/g.21668  ORF Transcript_7112/g.21668 Transcript_7112/m.21668 type:complete len:234 (-) Transcript_7112:432-1133(-)
MSTGPVNEGGDLFCPVRGEASHPTSSSPAPWQPLQGMYIASKRCLLRTGTKQRWPPYRICSIVRSWFREPTVGTWKKRRALLRTFLFWNRSSSRMDRRCSKRSRARSVSSLLPTSSAPMSAVSGLTPKDIPPASCLNQSIKGCGGRLAATWLGPASKWILALASHLCTSWAVVLKISCSLLSFTWCCCSCIRKLAVSVSSTAQPCTMPSALTPRRTPSECLAAWRRNVDNCLR